VKFMQKRFHHCQMVTVTFATKIYRLLHFVYRVNSTMYVLKTTTYYECKLADDCAIYWRLHERQSAAVRAMRRACRAAAGFLLEPPPPKIFVSAGVNRRWLKTSTLVCSSSMVRVVKIQELTKHCLGSLRQFDKIVRDHALKIVKNLCSY